MEAWRPPAGEEPWQPGAVHVWLAVMGPEPQPVPASLSEAERERAARFRFPRDRDLYQHHHDALRRILSPYAGTSAERLALAARKGGKPFLEAGGPWRFNLSHSGMAALVAVTHGVEVGVDIERVRPGVRTGAIAGRFFAPAERAAIEALPPDLREAAFFACWTRKEAFLKATGDGLGRRLSSFAAPPDPRDRGPWQVEGCTVLSLPAPPGYAAALAVAGGARPLRCWRFH